MQFDISLIPCALFCQISHFSEGQPKYPTLPLTNFYPLHSKPNTRIWICFFIFPQTEESKNKAFFFHLTSVMCYLKATKTCKIFKDCKTKCVLKWRNHQTLRFDVPMQLTVSMPLAGHALLACVWPHKSRIFYFLTKWAFLLSPAPTRLGIRKNTLTYFYDTVESRHCMK